MEIGSFTEIWIGLYFWRANARKRGKEKNGNKEKNITNRAKKIGTKVPLSSGTSVGELGRTCCGDGNGYQPTARGSEPVAFSIV